MHRRACQGENRRWQGRGYEHRRCMPLLQHDTTQGEASGGRGQTCLCRAFQTGEGQVAPGAGHSRFEQTNDPTNLNGRAPTACNLQVKTGAQKTSENVDLPKCIAPCIARSIVIGLICQCIGGNLWFCCNWGRVPPSPPFSACAHRYLTAAPAFFPVMVRFAIDGARSSARTLCIS